MTPHLLGDTGLIEEKYITLGRATVCNSGDWTTELWHSAILGSF